MRLHEPVHHTKQPHLSGIPVARDSYAVGGAVSGLSNEVPDVSSLTGNNGGGGGGDSAASMQSAPSAPSAGGGSAAPASVGASTPNLSQGQTGGGSGGGIDSSTPSWIPEGYSGPVGGQTPGPSTSTATNGPTNSAPAAAPAASGKLTPQQLGVQMGQGALQKAAANWQALNPTWKEPTWLSNAAGTSGSQGGMTSQPATANPASTGSQSSMTGTPAANNPINSGQSGGGAPNNGAWIPMGDAGPNFAEGGVVDDPSKSLNPLSHILGLTQNKMKDINKPPSGIPTEGPTKEQAGPQRKSENDDDSDDRPSFAEGGAVNDEDQGVVNPQSLLGGQQPAQPSTAADNAPVADPGNTLGGPAPSAGAQTVSGLVSSAKQSYQTVQQALQKAWSASKGTGQASSSATALNQPGATAPGGGGGGFAGNTAASGIPAPVSITPQGSSGQAQGAQLQSPTPSGAGNPVKPGAFPVQTTNVSGTPGGGQSSAPSAASPQGPVPPNMPQQPQQNPDLSNG